MVMSTFKSRYNQAYDGAWWHAATKKGDHVQCCDCGLIHGIKFKLDKKGRLMWAWTRENARTANVRRAKNFKKEHPLVK
jgi:hypothetical protein